MRFGYKVLVALSVLVIVTSIAAYAPTRRLDIDPIGAYNFEVQIQGVSVARFSSMEGLEIQVEVIETQSGDDIIVRKRPGRTTFSNIVLKRGYYGTTELSDWIIGVRNGQYDRRDIAIILNDNAGNSIKQWNLFGAFPVRWSISPLESLGDDVLYEEIEIAYEDFNEA